MASKVVGFLEKLKGTKLGKALTSRWAKFFGTEAAATALGLAVGEATQIGSIMLVDYLLMNHIADLGKALDELSSAIDRNSYMLDSIRDTLLKTRVLDAISRMTSRIASIKKAKRVLNWITGAVVFAEFSLIVIDFYEALFDYMLNRFQRFALIDFTPLMRDTRYANAFDSILKYYQTKDINQIAQENMREFIDIQHDFNLLASFFGALGRTSAMGQWLGFDALARTITNVTWSLGIGWLSWVAMGPGMRATIADPLEKYYNRLLRPASLTRETIQSLWKRNEINDEKFNDLLALQGYSDENIAYLKSLVYDIPSRSELQDLYENKQINDEELRVWFDKLKYHPNIADRMLELLKRKATESVLKSYISQVESNFLKGYRTENEIIDAYNLRISNINEDNLRILALKEKDYGERCDERVKFFIQQFRDKKIDEETLRTNLANIIKRPEVLENIIALEKQRLKPDKVVEPDETIQKRKKTIENRLEILSLQLTHERDMMKNQLAIIDAERDRVIADYDSRIRALENSMNARIKWIEDELEVSLRLKAEEVEARIRELTAVVEAKIRRMEALLDAKIKAIEDEYEAYKTATDMEIDLRVSELESQKAGLPPEEAEAIDAKIDLLIAMKGIPVIRRSLIKEARIARLKSEHDANVGYLRDELQLRIAFLRETMEMTADEKRARAESMIERIKEEMSAKIADLQNDKARKLAEIDDRRKTVELRYFQRIEKLALQISQLEDELEVLESALRKI